MKARYQLVISIDLVHDVDPDKITELKGNFEMGNDICTMISDEAVTCGGVACCTVLESRLNVE